MQHKVLPHYGGWVVAYNLPGTGLWTAITDYPLSAKATATAHAHALNVQKNPDLYQEMLRMKLKAEHDHLWKQKASNQNGYQKDLFNEEPPEDPAEDFWEEKVSKDSDIPF